MQFPSADYSRGFIADAARVRYPKDKPKVERGVPYAKERFFRGANFRDLAHIRSEAQRWCRDVADLRIHGTTRRKPLVVFQDEEREAFIRGTARPMRLRTGDAPKSASLYPRLEETRTLPLWQTTDTRWGSGTLVQLHQISFRI